MEDITKKLAKSYGEFLGKQTKVKTVSHKYHSGSIEDILFEAEKSKRERNQRTLEAGKIGLPKISTVTYNVGDVHIALGFTDHRSYLAKVQTPSKEYKIKGKLHYVGKDGENPHWKEVYFHLLKEVSKRLTSDFKRDFSKLEREIHKDLRKKKRTKQQ